MKLLLDTHYLIWLLNDDAQLDQRARKQIDASEAVYFSDVSILEIGLKWRTGKLSLEPRVASREALAMGVQHVTISTEAVLVSCELKQAHGDPFDRLLYAQAKVHGLRLLSVDRALLTFGATVVSSKGSSKQKAPHK